MIGCLDRVWLFKLVYVMIKIMKELFVKKMNNLSEKS